MINKKNIFVGAVVILIATFIPSHVFTGLRSESLVDRIGQSGVRVVSAQGAVARDVSRPLASLAPSQTGKKAAPASGFGIVDNGTAITPHDIDAGSNRGAITAGKDTSPLKEKSAPLTAASVEQTEQGTRAAPEIVANFDGLGVGFIGPQGTARFRNPSDNSLAVGPDHIIQTVNSKMAIFTKKGSRFDMTGRVLYGPVDTNNIFRDFGDAAKINNGDAVVRYDQLADRWLIVMPIFRRLPPRPDDPLPAKPGEPAHLSPPAVKGQPGPPMMLFQPPPPTPEEIAALEAAEAERAKRMATAKKPGQKPPQKKEPREEKGAYAMCYAVSTSPDPLGSYYRYQFVRPLFPDYPRPAIWPDGYYVPTSTGDHVIQKHAYVVDRNRMLKGEDATEQGFVIDGVNFLNNADLDGKQLPPSGAPNIVMAAGGAQLKKIMDDNVILVWKFHVDWKDPSKTSLRGRSRFRSLPTTTWAKAS